MENKTKLFVLLTIIFVVVSITLGAIVIHLINNPITIYKTAENQNVLDTNNVSQNSDENKEELNSTNVSQNIAQSKTEVTNQSEMLREMTANEKYKIFIEGLKNNRNNFSKFKLYAAADSTSYDATIPADFILSHDFSGGINWISINSNGDTYLAINEDSALAKKYGTEHKIGSNIVKAGIMNIFQDMGIFIYLIDENGTFSYCFYYGPESTGTDETNLNFTVTNKLKNIVSIQPAYDNGCDLLATDIEGNVFVVSKTLNLLDL